MYVCMYVCMCVFSFVFYCIASTCIYIHIYIYLQIRCVYISYNFVVEYIDVYMYSVELWCALFNVMYIFAVCNVLFFIFLVCFSSGSVV